VLVRFAAARGRERCTWKASRPLRCGERTEGWRYDARRHDRYFDGPRYKYETRYGYEPRYGSMGSFAWEQYHRDHQNGGAGYPPDPSLAPSLDCIQQRAMIIFKLVPTV
jgi:hypothetical protein